MTPVSVASSPAPPRRAALARPSLSKLKVSEEDPQQNLDLQYDLAQIAGVLFTNANVAKVMPFAGRLADLRDDVLLLSRLYVEIAANVRFAVVDGNWSALYLVLGSKLMEHLNQLTSELTRRLEDWPLIDPSLRKANRLKERDDEDVNVPPAELTEAMGTLGLDSLDPVFEFLAAMEPGQRAAASVAFSDSSPKSEQTGTLIFGSVPRSGDCGEIAVRPDGMVGIWDWADHEESDRTGKTYAFRLIGHESDPDIDQTIARFRDWQAAYYEIRRWLQDPVDGGAS